MIPVGTYVVYPYPFNSRYGSDQFKNRFEAENLVQRLEEEGFSVKLIGPYVDQFCKECDSQMASQGSVELGARYCPPCSEVAARDYERMYGDD